MSTAASITPLMLAVHDEPASVAVPVSPKRRFLWLRKGPTLPLPSVEAELVDLHVEVWTRAFQDFYGLEPTPPEAREARPPPMMSQGGFHRVMSRLRSLADRGFVPTHDELASAASIWNI